MKFFKKNWKKILVGLALAIAGVAVGKKYLPRKG